MIKLVTCLKRLPALSPEAFQRYWRTTHADIVRTLPGICRYVQSHVLRESYAKGAPVYDGIAEIWVRDTNAVRAFQKTPEMKKLQEDEPKFFRVHASPLIITEEHPFSDRPEKEDAVKVMELITRKKGLSVEDFQAYWLHEHGPMVKRVSDMRGYVQSHTRLSGYGRIRPPAYDGMSSYWLDDLLGLEDLERNPEYGTVDSDRVNFQDVGKTRSIVTREWPIL